jgi:hypothetical protein
MQFPSIFSHSAKVPKELVLEVSERLRREAPCLIDASEGLRVALVMRRIHSCMQQRFISQHDTCMYVYARSCLYSQLHRLYGDR